MPPPLQVDNIFVFICQVVPILACWLFKTSATSWPFDLEIGVRVTYDVGYLCTNLSLPRPLCSRLRPDVRDRQTDVRQKHRLMLPPYGGRGIIVAYELLHS